MGSRIAAVVVTYNRKKLLVECLEALLNQTYPLDLIILIDNASTDGTTELLNEKGYLANSKIEYIRLLKNTGSSGGFYEGIKKAYERLSDWIWIMDDDAEPLNDALQILLESEKIKDDKVGILANIVVYPNDEVCYFHRCNFNLKKLSLQSVASEAYREEIFETDVVSFVGMLISKDMVSDIGLPLKKFFIYSDDAEYSLRAKKMGWKIFVLTASKIIHKSFDKDKETTSLKENLSWRYYYTRRNMIYTYKLYGEPINYFLKVVFITIRAQAAILLFKQKKFLNSKILWLATLDGLRGYFDRKIS